MNYVGYKNRFVYIPKQMKTLPSDPKGHDNMFNDSLIKYDFENEKIMGQIDYGTAKTSGEVFFQAREEAKSEDDGYLMTTLHDWTTDTSEFVIWDAQTLARVLTAPLKQRVPNGFHTLFVLEKDMGK